MSARVPILLFLIGVAFFPGGLNVFYRFNLVALRVFLQEKDDYLHHLVTPWSGEARALPAPIPQIAAWFRAYGISQYQYPPGWEKDPRIFHRLIEGVWPARYSRTAPYRLILGPGKLPSGCQTLQTAQGVTLAQCQ